MHKRILSSLTGGVVKGYTKEEGISWPNKQSVSKERNKVEALESLWDKTSLEGRRRGCA